MATDPVESALLAIAAYFNTAVVGLGEAKVGWPEHEDDFDLSSGPVITVVKTRVERRMEPPTVLTRTNNGANDVDVLYRTGALEIIGQLDLHCAHKAEREDFGSLVEDAWNNQLPLTTGLWVTSSDYHSRPLSVEQGAGADADEAGAATTGEWRRRWAFRCVTDLAQLKTLPRLVDAEYTVDTELGADTVTDGAQHVTP